MAAESRPHRKDPTAELRERVAEKAAENRRLLQENQRLQGELRRANAQAAIADRLHSAKMEGRGRVSESARAAGLAEGFSWNTSPASLGSPTAAQSDCTGTALAPAELYGSLGDLQRHIADAEAAGKQAAEEVEALRHRLCLDDELDAMRNEVDKMRKLVDEQAPMADDELVRLSSVLPQDAQDDEKDDSLIVPREALKSDSSFEMLSTLGEMERADAKKVLQSRLVSLSRELRSLQASANGRYDPSGAIQADRRRQRRLQQADTLATGMHQELRRHASSGMTSPRSFISGTSDAVSNISPVTQRSMLSGPSGTPSIVSSAGKAFDAVRVQRLDRGIQQFSRRFALRAGTR